MATLISVQTEVPVSPPITSITLELSLEEAQTLLDISYRIGGPPAQKANSSKKPSRRQHVDAIAKTLLGAGVKSLTHDDYTGQMYFNVSGEE